jgi:NCAIR mutase (PurE)-related protein
VTPEEGKELLARYKEGRIAEDELLRLFQAAPVIEFDFAKIDTHRSLRKGFPEVIFGSGKTPEHVVEIAAAILSRDSRVLITRIHEAHATLLAARFPEFVFHKEARIGAIELSPLAKRPGVIAVLCAGTSDLPIAEEAALTAAIMGNQVERLYDVGVSGLHRLMRHLDAIQKANVIIVVAGMEGALPSVVAGLVSRPVIAVPTSIGYGANFGGLAALLGMLNSCGSGVTVVNIDNGFGAAYAASQINALVAGNL